MGSRGGVDRIEAPRILGYEAELQKLNSFYQASCALHGICHGPASCLSKFANFTLPHLHLAPPLGCLSQVGVLLKWLNGLNLWSRPRPRGQKFGISLVLESLTFRPHIWPSSWPQGQHFGFNLMFGLLS